jgi:hypothetical protein
LIGILCWTQFRTNANPMTAFSDFTSAKFCSASICPTHPSTFFRGRLTFLHDGGESID